MYSGYLLLAVNILIRSDLIHGFSSLKTSTGKGLISQLPKCESGTAARRVLENAFPKSETEQSFLYDSISVPKGASDRSLSDADLAIQTNIRNSKYSVMDLIELNGDRDADRASLALFCVFVAGTLSALVAQESLPGPEIIRFAVVWLLSFSPLAFVGFGIATPDELQTLLVSIQRNVFPTYRKRMIHHEAGHFLVGHILGLPIKGYQANAVKNAVEFYPLNDADVGRERASLLGFNAKKIYTDQDVTEYDSRNYNVDFFAEGGRGDELLSQSVFRDAKNYTDNPFLKIDPQNDVKKAWPYRGFDDETIDKLAVVSVAGVCSEILAFGNAEGGYADLSQLRYIFANAESDLSDKDIENRIRYAVGFGMTILRRHLGALDDVVLAMEKNSSVEDCILAIENCENKSGASAIENYEQIRREKIKMEGVSVFERTLLMGGKNLDTEDSSIIEGKGGGGRNAKFQMTGDDPLYAAVAAAFLFFVWASTGGLALH